MASHPVYTLILVAYSRIIVTQAAPEANLTLRGSPEAAAAASGQAKMIQAQTSPDANLTPEGLAEAASTEHASAKKLSFRASKGVKYEQQCYGYTGFSCLTGSCPANSSSVCKLGSCVCSPGCSSANGVCHANSTNKVIAEGFRLANVKWPKYHLYVQKVSGVNQMKVTDAFEFLNFGQDKFNLFQLPPDSEEPKFFLGSGKWPNYIAAIRATTGTTFGLWGLYATRLKTTLNPWKPRDITLTVCSLKSRGRPDAIMIGSAGMLGSPIWAYIKHGSWLVYGYSHGAYPGEGGHWIPEPALPSGSVPEC